MSRFYDDEDETEAAPVAVSRQSAVLTAAQRVDRISAEKFEEKGGDRDALINILKEALGG